MSLEVGKTYRVNHSRKGAFTAVITDLFDEWATCRIVQGRARAMLHYNECGEGDDLTVRRSHCTFTPVAPVVQRLPADDTEGGAL